MGNEFKSSLRRNARAGDFPIAVDVHGLDEELDGVLGQARVDQLGADHGLLEHLSQLDRGDAMRAWPDKQEVLRIEKVNAHATWVYTTPSELRTD